MKKLWLLPVLLLGLSFSACQKETVPPEPQAEADVSTKGLTPMRQFTFTPSEVHLYRYNGETTATLMLRNEFGHLVGAHPSYCTIFSFTGPVDDPKTLVEITSAKDGRVVVSLKNVPYMYEQPTKATIYYNDGVGQAYAYVTVHMVKQLEPPLDPLY